MTTIKPYQDNFFIIREVKEFQINWSRGSLMPLLDQHKRDIMCRETEEVQRFNWVGMRVPISYGYGYRFCFPLSWIRHQLHSLIVRRSRSLAASQEGKDLDRLRIRLLISLLWWEIEEKGIGAQLKGKRRFCHPFALLTFTQAAVDYNYMGGKWEIMTQLGIGRPFLKTIISVCENDSEICIWKEKSTIEKTYFY